MSVSPTTWLMISSMMNEPTVSQGCCLPINTMA